jgi:hypothetical protein
MKLASRIASFNEDARIGGRVAPYPSAAPLVLGMDFKLPFLLALPA